MRLRAVRVIFAVVAVAAAPALAQPTRVIDEASFTITRAGAPFGTENFKIIRRLGSEGIEYVAQGTRTMEGRVVRTVLTTDSSGTPTSYSRGTTGAGRGQLTGRRAISRLTVNDEGPQGSSRDYALAAGSVILDSDVIAFLYFVTWRDPRAMDFVSPAARSVGHGVLAEVGRENLTIGRTAIPAIHYTFGEGADRREIWIDSDRRLLKVADPAGQVVGTRDLPPR